MIKRLYYNVDHGDRDSHSDSSSSSSSSDGDLDDAAPSSPSHSDPSPQHPDDDEVEGLSAPNSDGEGLSANDDESTEELKYQDEDSLPDSKDGKRKKFFFPGAQPDEYVLKCKSVFKCRVCPKVVCLTEETLKTHLNSKRHARSKKLLNEGRLKLVLNSDGEIEEDAETHAERHVRTIALSQDVGKSKKRPKGRQRQRNRSKKKVKLSCPKEENLKQMARPQTKKGR